LVKNFKKNLMKIDIFMIKTNNDETTILVSFFTFRYPLKYFLPHEFYETYGRRFVKAYLNSAEK